MTPEELFLHLLASGELVTYRRAHELLIGPVKDWRHAHTKNVVRLVLGTPPQVVAGLRVRLDALVVDASKRRPGEAHFFGKDYSENDWIRAFGTWALCSHPPRAITGQRTTGTG